MEDEHKDSQGEDVEDGKAPANQLTRAGVAAGEGVGLFLYSVSGLWIIFGLWAWIHPKSLQKLIGPRYTIIDPEREAKKRKAARP